MGEVPGSEPGPLPLSSESLASVSDTLMMACEARGMGIGRDGVSMAADDGCAGVAFFERN